MYIGIRQTIIVKIITSLIAATAKMLISLLTDWTVKWIPYDLKLIKTMYIVFNFENFDNSNFCKLTLIPLQTIMVSLMQASWNILCYLIFLSLWQWFQDTNHWKKNKTIFNIVKSDFYYSGHGTECIVLTSHLTSPSFWHHWLNAQIIGENQSFQLQHLELINFKK